jgi:translation elongation factor EF-1alpha
MDASSQNINNECDIAIIRDYLFLCKCIGIKDIIVIINKMEKVKYSEIVFDKLVSKMKKIVVDQFKFKESHVKYIPVDGLNGENLFEKSKNPLLSWYKDDYLFSYLDKIEMVKKEEEKEGLSIKKMIHEPFKMVVKDYMREGGISGSSVTVEGRICSGSIQIGDNLFTIPNYDVPFIRAIECQGQLVKFATVGDYVKIGLGNIDISKISKDTILSSIEQPIKLVNKFKAQILVNSSNIPVIKGTNAIMYINNNQESVYIKKIKMKKIKNPENNKIHYKRTTIIPKNTTAEVMIQLHDRRRLPLETYMKHRPFGRFILQHDAEIIASGVVLELL